MTDLKLIWINESLMINPAHMIAINKIKNDKYKLIMKDNNIYELSENDFQRLRTFLYIF